MARSRKSDEELLRLARKFIYRRQVRVLGASPKAANPLSRKSLLAQARVKAQADAAVKEKADAAFQALAEMFSDTKVHGRGHRTYEYDPERQEFIEDQLDSAIEEAIQGGKPRRARRIRNQIARPEIATDFSAIISATAKPADVVSFAVFI
jgi:hypothetical protein